MTIIRILGFKGIRYIYCYDGEAIQYITTDNDLYIANCAFDESRNVYGAITEETFSNSQKLMGQVKDIQVQKDYTLITRMDGSVWSYAPSGITKLMDGIPKSQDVEKETIQDGKNDNNEKTEATSTDNDKDSVIKKEDLIEDRKEELPQENTNVSESEKKDSNTNNKVGDTKTVQEADCNVILTSVDVTNPTVEYSGPNDKTITTVKIPDAVMIDGVTYKVTSVGEKAFAGCKKIKKITLGRNIRSIENKAFTNCTKLSTVNIDSNCIVIGSKAFYKCNNLTKVTIPENVITVDKSAFESCTRLKSLIIKSKNIEKIGKNALKNIT